MKGGLGVRIYNVQSARPKFEDSLVIYCYRYGLRSQAQCECICLLLFSSGLSLSIAQCNIESKGPLVGEGIICTVLT
jgi:hypothetical protein